MSAGPFEIATYETSSLALGGVTMPIRIQPETRGLSIGGNGNDGGAAAPDFPYVFLCLPLEENTA